MHRQKLHHISTDTEKEGEGVDQKVNTCYLVSLVRLG